MRKRIQKDTSIRKGWGGDGKGKGMNPLTHV